MKDSVTGTLKHIASNTELGFEGVTRFPYSKPWFKAQEVLIELFEPVFDTVSVDEMGNIVADLKGTDSETFICVGSHYDSVENAGMYDGVYGIIGGFYAIKNLVESIGRPKEGIRFVAFAEEEGVCFDYSFLGSHSFLGLMSNEEYNQIKDKEGTYLKDIHKTLGYQYIQEDAVKHDISGYIEMHIEQGPKLENNNMSIGIVTDIVGILYYEITLEGFANHAGTTSMQDRQDPMLAYLKFAPYCLSKVEAYADMVMTFGSIKIEPGNPNVIPNSLTFTIDCRSPYLKDLMDMKGIIESQIVKASEVSRVTSKVIDMRLDEPVSMNDELVGIIEEQCQHLKIPALRMHSGAGHDAQIMGLHVPSAMIFVPSHQGISHNPNEYTSEEDLQKGVQVLKETLRKIAYE